MAKQIEKVIRIIWSLPQSRALRSLTRYLDVEGAIRAGKTTVGIWKVITWAQEYPGINILICRWTGDALDAQLKPRFWELVPPELLDREKPWHSDEEYAAFANGSRVYIRALRSSEDLAKYAKVAGLTLAMILVDQPEEIPEDMYLYLKGRLSQKGYPHQMMILPNPTNEDHWIAREFPTDNSREGHEYIPLSTYDNAANLDAEYIRDLEASYPEGHPMRRRLLLGLRGATTVGIPVYGKIFKKDLHVRAVRVDTKLPLLESWDFAFRHPAVSWHQITKDGAWKVVGSLMGRNEYLEDFIPKVMQARARMLGKDQQVWVTCDPSGAVPTSHGSKRTAVQILQENSINPVVNPKANLPEVRAYAIEHVARLLLRLTPEGPAFQADPSNTVIIDGMTAGYVYPEKLVRGQAVPLKDGFYDHLQNTVEYAILAFAVPGESPHQTLRPVEEEEDEDAREARVKRRTAQGRAGY